MCGALSRSSHRRISHLPPLLPCTQASSAWPPWACSLSLVPGMGANDTKSAEDKIVNTICKVTTARVLLV